MGFWWFMLICTLLTPLLMIIAGRMMWKHCPRSINSIFGYRTARSMLNMDTWRFAHDNCGRLWWKLGWLLLIPTLLVFICLTHASQNLLAGVGLGLCMIQLVVLVTSLIPTERALRQAFLPDGTHRTASHE